MSWYTIGFNLGKSRSLLWCSCVIYIHCLQGDGNYAAVGPSEARVLAFSFGQLVMSVRCNRLHYIAAGSRSVLQRRKLLQGPKLRLRLLPNVEQHRVLHPRRKPGSRSTLSC